MFPGAFISSQLCGFFCYIDFSREWALVNCLIEGTYVLFDFLAKWLLFVVVLGS